MNLNMFEFDLPEGQIARYPAPQKSQARLLVVDRQSRSIHHKYMADLPDILGDRYHLIANDSAVVPSSLELSSGRKVAFGSDVHSGEWKLLGPTEDVIHPHRDAQVSDIAPANQGAKLAANLTQLWDEGTVTYPRYLKHLLSRYPKGVPAFYNNSFAKTPGSVALPSGGFNLTPQLLNRLRSRGAGFSTLTLHIGHVTFKRPKSDNLSEHKMEGERYKVSPKTAHELINAKVQGKGLLAIGTTSIRSLEHIGQSGGLNPEGHQGVSDLFIQPGYEFKLVDGLLTGLHGPKTTLFMLVCAMGGHELVKQAYQQALALDYRWYTLGDSMLIL